MCVKVNIPVLGVVENMSCFIDTAGVKHELFGKGGGQAVADFAKAPLLGQIPIDQTVREWGDKGTPGRAGRAREPDREGVPRPRRQGGRGRRRRAPTRWSDDGGAPVIDRSGGPGGKRRLPVTK